MNRRAASVKNWRNRVKQRLIAYKGGKCQRCGYDKIEYPRAFSFHHRDRNQKDFGISGKSWGFEYLKAEVDKCDLLCVRCHAEVHDEIDAEKREKRLKIKAVRLQRMACKNCGKEFQPDSCRRVYCTIDCSRIAERKVERPSKEQLEKDLSDLSYLAVGRKYGVSDNAVRKWLKYYNAVIAPM